jgi:hypothetical protein
MGVFSHGQHPRWLQVGCNQTGAGTPVVCICRNLETQQYAPYLQEGLGAYRGFRVAEEVAQEGETRGGEETRRDEMRDKITPCSQSVSQSVQYGKIQYSTVQYLPLPPSVLGALGSSPPILPNLASFPRRSCRIRLSSQLGPPRGPMAIGPLYLRIPSPPPAPPTRQAPIFSPATTLVCHPPCLPLVVCALPGLCHPPVCSTPRRAPTCNWETRSPAWSSWRAHPAIRLILHTSSRAERAW